MCTFGMALVRSRIGWHSLMSNTSASPSWWRQFTFVHKTLIECSPTYSRGQRLIVAGDNGLNRAATGAYFAGWPAAYGRSSISPAPIAGWITLRPKSSIQTSVRAVSNAWFAGPRSTHGPAFMVSSIGRPPTSARVLFLGKRGDRQARQTPWDPNQPAETIIDIAPAKSLTAILRQKNGARTRWVSLIVAAGRAGKGGIRGAYSGDGDNCSMLLRRRVQTH
jgi:hypothetical protein